MLTLTELHFDSFTCGYNHIRSHFSRSIPDGQKAYVGSFRGRQSVKIVCPEFKPLLGSVKKTPAGDHI